MSDDRPAVYYEDDILIIRASSIGNTCLFELAAAGQGYDPVNLPASIQRAFDRGHELEDQVIALYCAQEFAVWSDAQKEGELTVLPNLKIRYHLDGLILVSDMNWVGEVKTMANSTWQKAKRHGVASTFSEYAWQASTMMYGEAEHHTEPRPLLWICYNKGETPDETGYNTWCPDQGQLYVEPLFTPPIPRAKLFAKALEIKELVDGDDILDSGLRCNDPSRWPCRYLHLRPEGHSAVLREPSSKAATLLQVDDETAADVDRLVKEYLTFKGQADESIKRRDEAKHKLIELAGDNKGLETDHWYVPVVESSNSRLDWAAMPEALKNQVNEYRIKSYYKYLKNIEPKE